MTRPLLGPSSALWSCGQTLCCSALNNGVNRGHAPPTHYPTWLQHHTEQLEGFSWGAKSDLNSCHRCLEAIEEQFHPGNLTWTPGVQEFLWRTWWWGDGRIAGLGLQSDSGSITQSLKRVWSSSSSGATISNNLAGSSRCQLKTCIIPQPRRTKTTQSVKLIQPTDQVH